MLAIGVAYFRQCQDNVPHNANHKCLSTIINLVTQFERLPIFFFFNLPLIDFISPNFDETQELVHPVAAPGESWLRDAEGAAYMEGDTAPLPNIGNLVHR